MGYNSDQILVRAAQGDDAATLAEEIKVAQVEAMEVFRAKPKVGIIDGKQHFDWWVFPSSSRNTPNWSVDFKTTKGKQIYGILAADPVYCTNYIKCIETYLELALNAGNKITYSVRFAKMAESLAGMTEDGARDLQGIDKNKITQLAASITKLYKANNHVFISEYHAKSFERLEKIVSATTTLPTPAKASGTRPAEKPAATPTIPQKIAEPAVAKNVTSAASTPKIVTPSIITKDKPAINTEKQDQKTDLILTHPSTSPSKINVIGLKDLDKNNIAEKYSEILDKTKKEIDPKKAIFVDHLMNAFEAFYATDKGQEAIKNSGKDAGLSAWLKNENFVAHFGNDLKDGSGKLTADSIKTLKQVSAKIQENSKNIFAATIGRKYTVDGKEVDMSRSWRIALANKLIKDSSETGKTRN